MSEYYCYSHNNEDFEGWCHSREEALAQALEYYENREDYPENIVYTAKCVPPKPSDFLPWIADYLYEEADSEYHEHADGWLDMSEKEEKSLQNAVEEAVDRWCKQHDHMPRFYRLEDVQEHQRPTDDGNGNGLEESFDRFFYKSTMKGLHG